VSLQHFVDAKNTIRKSKWWTRWLRQGGSLHWQARPMQDLRNEEDLRRWREIELKRRHTRFGGDKGVVNLAQWRLRRARRSAVG